MLWCAGGDQKTTCGGQFFRLSSMCLFLLSHPTSPIFSTTSLVSWQLPDLGDTSECQQGRYERTQGQSPLGTPSIGHTSAMPSGAFLHSHMPPFASLPSNDGMRVNRGRELHESGPRNGVIHGDQERATRGH